MDDSSPSRSGSRWSWPSWSVGSPGRNPRRRPAGASAVNEADAADDPLDRSQIALFLGLDDGQGETLAEIVGAYSHVRSAGSADLERSLSAGDRGAGRGRRAHIERGQCQRGSERARGRLRRSGGTGSAGATPGCGSLDGAVRQRAEPGASRLRSCDGEGLSPRPHRRRRSHEPAPAQGDRVTARARVCDRRGRVGRLGGAVIRGHRRPAHGLDDARTRRSGAVPARAGAGGQLRLHRADDGARPSRAHPRRHGGGGGRLSHQASRFVRRPDPPRGGRARDGSAHHVGPDAGGAGSGKLRIARAVA